MVSESTLESAALEWLDKLGYTIAHGPDIAPETEKAERKEFGEAVLAGRLKTALQKLNPKVPGEALEDAFAKILRAESPSLVVRNRRFHQMFTDGVDVEYRNKEGRIVHDKVKIADFESPKKNDWLAVNQFTVIENGFNRRLDVVIFLNGLPVAVMELKNPGDENASIWSAYNQLQTYKQQIPSLFTFNEVLVISDGVHARLGSITSGKERFGFWRTIDGEKMAKDSDLQLEVLVRGLFEPERFLDYLHGFIVFEEEKEIHKKLAGYHQFRAVRKALRSTLKATQGDRRAGVIWHTQGSGKSLTMVYYAGRVVLAPEMENPTLVVLTDRNDLDGQLFGVFGRCKDILRQTPEQAEDRDDLQKLLKRASGGIIFTTIQKFLPETKGGKYPVLSDRRNIVVIADEAHRSQYGFSARMDADTGAMRHGFAQHLRDALPNASFIGFTGTPIELTDKNTQAVFGKYVDIYDIQQAVKDEATVPIYYEGRLARLELKEDERPKLDPEFEEITEGEEEESREKLKTKWAALEALVGSEKRLQMIARDLVKHFEERQKTLGGGKAMIVCMSRRICVDLYDALAKLRPEWHNDDDRKGALKIIMTGAASDKAEWQKHIRTKAKREELAERFRDAKDPFQIVIVRDMWLTGFDAPCLHTMYVDKPMRGHGLMQAIARVNRVFGEKPGGLVVDYLGLADQLKNALHNYTESGGKGETAIDQEQAARVLVEKYEICAALFEGFDLEAVRKGAPAERLALLPKAQQHILSEAGRRDRFLQASAELGKAFALAAPHPETIRIRDEVAFFQALRGVLAKWRGSSGTGDPSENLEFALRQLVSEAVAPGGVVDIFAAAGIKKPDISILSEEFLREVQGMPHRNLAIELLQKLLRDEIKLRSKMNLIQSRRFSEMLERSLKNYQARAIETAKILEELVSLAKDMREAHERGEDLKLTDEELAFYDALETNNSAVKILGDEILRTIAQELVKTLKANTAVDWTVRESIRAKMRALVKRILRKYDYPPDMEEEATKTVLKQAELLCENWPV
ncbi:MAG: type I restriction endonuclease subunit R [Bdellovibrionota bacterium]